MSVVRISIQEFLFIIFVEQYPTDRTLWPSGYEIGLSPCYISFRVLGGRPSLLDQKIPHTEYPPCNMDPALMGAIATANWVEGGESDYLSIFNTDSVTAADKTSTIKRVHLACTGTLDNVRGIYSYHWRLFFQLTPVEANLVEKRSVELHVTLLNKGTGMANTIAMSRNYENTHRSVATTYWDVVDDEWTVNDMLNLIIHDKKRSRFLFDVASGSGCACWCIAVLGDIEDAGNSQAGSRKPQRSS